MNKQPDEAIHQQVNAQLLHKEVWSVEEIQHIIEEELFAHSHFEVMRAFMLYRHTRKLQREQVYGLNASIYAGS